MYHPGMNYSREGGMLWIPTRFVWPYGGRIVFISGSFTGWTQWPMTPVEGCSTVFQTICSLPPGYHQYKFVVDGEWRHDEHQPFISSSIGTVNTILITRESEFLPPMLSQPMTLSGPVSNMEVDNNAINSPYRMVRLREGTPPEPIPTVSDADIEISRHQIDLFMSTHLAYELLPESGKVIALDVELPVKQAFHILHDQGIPMAALWNSPKGKFVGVLSALDFILIMRELGSKGSNLTEEELDTHTISAWKEAKSYMNSQVAGQGCASKQLIQAGPDDSLKSIVLKILQNGVSTVPVIHYPSADPSNPQLLHLASLSGILKCICRFFKHSPSSLPVLQSPICAIPLGTWDPKIGTQNEKPLAMLRPNAPLSVALDLLIQAQVSSIPIVHEHDFLLDVYSRSDITTLAKDKMYTHINLEETSVHQALQLRDDPISLFGTNQRYFTCLRTDPFHKVLERLSQPGVRRLIVVEAGYKRVEGIISLGDVFRFLMAVKQ
ncbi:sucrose nonfermenting 4-like protein [Andrographis paniculata]|uniref:sucrose nonfermenting 4-like protein n=1 Tax=Andrographis paniculata TaxID=175694 RepID=UPI0021E8D81E|nr:sucrose nonfermenting 4-like protein [Andrographis paniculata]XP_051129953.1 sucrose nonfermenting 4-like protein [Andrographis paniculata]